MQSSYSEISGKNSFELAQDKDFKDAVEIIINNQFYESNAILFEAIKNLIDEFCYVEKNKIKCK